MIAAFTMNQIVDFFKIRPVFEVDTVMWSEEINEILVEEHDSETSGLSDLILTGFEEHYQGNWGNVSSDQKMINDQSLQNYFRGLDLTTPLRSSYSNGIYNINVTTEQTKSRTYVTLKQFLN